MPQLRGARKRANRQFFLRFGPSPPIEHSVRSAPNHVDEELRLRALHRLGVLDTGPEERFDRITRLLSTVLDVPISLVSLIDSDRQWFKSCVGLEATQTSRDVAFCSHAIVEVGDLPFVITDAQLDERFFDNPLVVGDPGVRFYAGQVLRDPSGLPMGTLCAIDRKPRQLNADEQQALVDLAHMVEQELAHDAQRSILLQLDESESRKALILDTMTEGLVFQDRDGRILNWNPAAERVLGLSAEELSGRTSIDPRWRAIHEDGTPWPGETHPAMESLHTGQPVNGQIMGVHQPHGSLVWLRVNANPVLDAQGRATSVLTAFADITLEHELMIEQRRFSYLFRNATDIITVIDTTGRTKFTSPSAERLLGVDPSVAAGGMIWDAIHRDDHEPTRQVLHRVTTTSEPSDPFTTRVRDASGGWRHLECVAVNLLAEPAVSGIVLTARDVTERHQIAEALAYSASHDELTDLPNRRKLSAHIASALERAASEHRHVALCFVDLDRFKEVNDTFGHAVGDRLLVAAGQAIRHTARSGDHAARVGGDEFVVLLDPVADQAEAEAIADRIHHAILGQYVQGLPDGLAQASVGVAVSEPDDTPSSLMQRADTALYATKATRSYTHAATSSTNA